MTTWMPGAEVRDLTNGFGNGPFRSFLGVILHVNVSPNGTGIGFWGPNNSNSVTPNFQVMKDGSIDQMLPFNWQPWCQVDGNFNYAAIETAGMPDEPLTEAQCISISKILKVYHNEMGMPLQIANTPGQRGFGVHSMGGDAWGGHACPGTIRANQRQHILNLAAGSTPPPSVTIKEEEMKIITNKDTPQELAVLVSGLTARTLQENERAAYLAIGTPVSDVANAHYLYFRSLNSK